MASFYFASIFRVFSGWGDGGGDEGGGKSTGHKSVKNGIDINRKHDGTAGPEYL